MKEADVVVVGAGIVGLSAARALAATGARVLVCDRGQPGAEASSAAAGWLAAQAEADPGSPVLHLGLLARARHGTLAVELWAETEIDVEHSPRGTIELAFSEAEERILLHRLDWQRALGLPATSMSHDEVVRAEPNVNPAVRSGLFLSRDRSIDNVALARALAASVVANGATLLSGRAVTELLLDKGRVAGVRTSQETLRAPVVIEAMGAWSAHLAGDPAPPPVEPVRGQIVAFDVPGHLSHVVCTARGYIVPRANGRLLAGSTLERAGFEKNVTPGGLETVLRIALEIAPGLAHARVADSWAGLRPGTPDGLPIIGAGAVPGLFHATGLYRSGILLGPLVGEAAARLALGQDPGVDLSAFSASRFRSA